jgi:hypothetical protein
VVRLTLCILFMQTMLSVALIAFIAWRQPYAPLFL